MYRYLNFQKLQLYIHQPPNIQFLAFITKLLGIFYLYSLPIGSVFSDKVGAHTTVFSEAEPTGRYAPVFREQVGIEEDFTFLIHALRFVQDTGKI